MPDTIVVETKPVEVVPEVVATPEVTLLMEKDKEITQLREERDNYKVVALKRLGKLPGDADFMKGADESTGLTVEETVKNTLLSNEIKRLEREKEEGFKKLERELSETKLALKNRPGAGSTGGNDGGATVEVKDNVFSQAQLDQLTATAIRLKADPVKFIERAKKNFASR